MEKERERDVDEKCATWMLSQTNGRGKRTVIEREEKRGERERERESAEGAVP